MKRLVTMLSLIALTGCSTYQTHLRTGCIMDCAKWENVESTVNSTTQPSNTNYVSSRQYITPVGSYMAIRSGSTTTIIQTAKSK